jgi:hypothetical protein
MDFLNPTVATPIQGVATHRRSFVQAAHRAIERHRATTLTALIIVLTFAIATHFPDQIPTLAHHYRGR